jgi:hypothetical protein
MTWGISRTGPPGTSQATNRSSHCAAVAFANSVSSSARRPSSSSPNSSAAPVSVWRLLDLDHVGAQRRELSAGESRRDQDAEIEHLDTGRGW